MSGKNIPFLDLKAQYRSIKSEIDDAMQGIVENQSFIMGPSVSNFESNFAMFADSEHAIGVGNGTDALVLALKALGVKAGDEVVTTPHTFISTAEAITATGASIKWVDCDPDTGLIQTEAIEQAIRPQTRVIIPVHLYGQMVDVKRIRDMLDSMNRMDIRIIEDAAQAHGARFNNESPGTYSDMATYSFFPGKNLGAYGDGGMITTNHSHLAGWLKKARNHGRKEKYTHEFPSVNSRLDALQAAILDVKLKHLHQWTVKRNQVATWYQEALKEDARIEPLFHHKKADHAFHLYVVRVNNRDKVRADLQEQGISTGIHYPIPLHIQPAYQSAEYPEGSFPNSERLANRILSCPIYPELSQEETDAVITALKASTGAH